MLSNKYILKQTHTLPPPSVLSECLPAALGSCCVHCNNDECDIVYITKAIEIDQQSEKNITNEQ